MVRYANVAATLALVFAMGGTSYAAYTLPHNSVGSWQIRPSAVQVSDIAANSITSGKVRDGSLRRFDFAPGQLPAGPQGPAGEAAAYANVLGAGVVGGPTPSRGFPANAIQHPSAGVYCFGGLGFQPASAMVSINDAGSNAAAPARFVASVSTWGSMHGCTYPHHQVRVTITQIDPAPGVLKDHDFSIWLESSAAWRCERPRALAPRRYVAVPLELAVERRHRRERQIPDASYPVA